MAVPWEERVRAKRQSILASVPPAFIHAELAFSQTDPASVMDVPAQFLTPDELAITDLAADSLAVAIATGTYTAVAVLDAMTHRAVIAHQLLHCCLDFMYPEALARARQLDDAFQRSGGKTAGPLHGVPVSLKDQCRVKGTETTCGFVANLGTVDTENALLVDILLDAGAVPFCKTSLSVGCMWGETVNNILGRTSNPYNRAFSCGGSSGGEGTLIAIRGSPLGVGSDLGGSIRSPSAYQGLWGLRPSVGRIPYHKILNSMEGQETVASVVGPMARSVASLKLFAKTVVDAQSWNVDPKVVPIPWRQAAWDGILGPHSSSSSCRPLRIGLFSWDGVVLPQPPVRRALREVEAALRAAGHDVVAIGPEQLVDHKIGLSLALRVFASDNNGDVGRSVALSGEPPLSQIGQSDRSALGLLESWALAMERQRFQADVLAKWAATATLTGSGEPLDVYLAPVNPSVCPKHGDYEIVRHLAYTSTVNVCDFSACTIPVTFVDETLDLADSSPDRAAGGESIPAPTCDLDKVIRGRYDPAVYKGLPVTLQIVGKRLEEEKVLAIAAVFESLLQK